MVGDAIMSWLRGLGMNIYLGGRMMLSGWAFTFSHSYVGIIKWSCGLEPWPRTCHLVLLALKRSPSRHLKDDNRRNGQWGQSLWLSSRCYIYVHRAIRRCVWRELDQLSWEVSRASSRSPSATCARDDLMLRTESTCYMVMSKGSLIVGT